MIPRTSCCARHAALEVGRDARRESDQLDYPGRFSGVLHARVWLDPFFTWHNDDHQHSGLALFTPAEVFFGRVADVHRVRQATLDARYAQHP